MDRCRCVSVWKWFWFVSSTSWSCQCGHWACKLNLLMHGWKRNKKRSIWSDIILLPRYVCCAIAFSQLANKVLLRCSQVPYFQGLVQELWSFPVNTRAVRLYRYQLGCTGTSQHRLPWMSRLNFYVREDSSLWRQYRFVCHINKFQVQVQRKWIILNECEVLLSWQMLMVIS